MRAMTVVPGQKGTAGIEVIPDPDTHDGALLVRGMAVGICGTDREIADGAYGTPPPGEARLIIGHESLGEVLEAPPGSGFAPGDLVVGIVRRPDPRPCPACAAGEWAMCRTDGFGERGIVRLHGYGSEHWRVEPDFAVPILPRLGELGVLQEPASVLDARSAAPAGTRCSSPPRGRTSTTTRWPASRTQARYSRSMDSASVAFPACNTTAGHHVRPITRRADRGGGQSSTPVPADHGYGVPSILRRRISPSMPSVTARSVSASHT